jgi:hypothetical protein
MLRTERLVVWLIPSCLFLAAPAARASFELELSSGGTTVYRSSNTGLVNYTGSVGDFAVNITTGLSTTNPALISLSTVDVTAEGDGDPTLTVTLSRTGFTGLPTANGLLYSVASGTVAPGGTFTFQSWENSSDLSPIAGGAAFSVPAGSVTTGVQGPFGSPGVVNNTAVNVFPDPPFSLFDQFVINLGNGQADALSGSTFALPTPAPGGLTLALAGAPFLGLGLWMRRRQLCVA